MWSGDEERCFHEADTEGVQRIHLLRGTGAGNSGTNPPSDFYCVSLAGFQGIFVNAMYFRILLE